MQPAAAPGCGRSRAYLRRRADAPRDRRAIAKRHFVRRRCKTALCGERRGPSPGLARDPSSVHPRASAAQLRRGVQPLRGLGSGAVPLRCRTIAVRMRRSCGRLAAAKSPHVALRAARGGDDAAAVRACVRGGLACAMDFHKYRGFVRQIRHGIARSRAGSCHWCYKTCATITTHLPE